MTMDSHYILQPVWQANCFVNGDRPTQVVLNLLSDERLQFRARWIFSKRISWKLAGHKTEISVKLLAAAASDEVLSCSRHVGRWRAHQFCSYDFPQKTWLKEKP